jgi:hypothetical protein
MRILHVETHLLDCLDVRPGEGVDTREPRSGFGRQPGY